MKPILIAITLFALCCCAQRIVSSVEPIEVCDGLMIEIGCNDR